VAMASAGDRPFLVLGKKVGPGSWASSASLYRFVWVAERRCMSQSALHAVPGRAALALWISGLDLRDFRESGPRVASSDGEGMLD